MLLGYIDAHCHLSDARVFEKSDALIARAKKAGVSAVGLGGVEPAEWERQKTLLAKYPDFIKTSLGIHPWWVEKQTREDLERALKLQRAEFSGANFGAHAIGEAGLDFHERRDKTRFTDQEWIFRAQIELALSVKKPLVIHCVQAHPEVLAIVKEMGANAVPLLVHSFSGNPEQAAEWVKLGAFLSFSGAILKKDRYKKVKEAIVDVPLERLLIETDAPDQYWYEGESEPSYVEQVFLGAARLREEEVEILQDQVYFNFCEIFPET